MTPKNARRGESNGRHKLTEDQVKRIRQYAAFLPKATIAKLFNVRRMTIVHIVHRYSWKHI